MSNRFRLSFMALLIMAGFVFVSCEDDDDDKDEPFTTTQAHIDKSMTLVETVSGSEKYGEDVTIPHGGKDLTSDQTIREVYASNAGGLEYMTVLTKRTYMKKADGTKGDLLATFAMVKHEAGYSAESGDWEWFMMPNDPKVDYTKFPNGSITGEGAASGKADMAMCNGCHMKADGGDFSFVR